MAAEAAKSSRWETTEDGRKVRKAEHRPLPGALDDDEDSVDMDEEEEDEEASPSHAETDGEGSGEKDEV